jgi:uncharacterized membrane protein SirB2
MLESHYAGILALHVGCVALSGGLFTVRGFLRLGNRNVANHRALRIGSYLIDSTLLIAAVLLTIIVHQYPFVNAWLTAKLLLLVLYVALGSVALKYAKTRTGRLISLVSALSAFGLIVGVAVTHRPLGWLTLLH